MLLACANLFVAMVATASSPLDDARRHIREGKLDDALFDLQGKEFPGDTASSAADVMASAATAALSQKDSILALQFAQMTLRLRSDHPEAVSVAAKASFEQNQFDAAESYADKWIAVEPKRPQPKLLRAEIAVAEGEWDRAQSLVDRIISHGLSDADRVRLKSIKDKASAGLSQRSEQVSALKNLQRQIDSRAQAIDEAVHTAQPVYAPKIPSQTGVVLYGTSWCPYCRAARKWLRAHHVKFADKDVERDPDAVAELAQKAAAAHFDARGVPIIDVNGQLVGGFDREELERLLQ
jgi:glutaredoxin 3